MHFWIDKRIPNYGYNMNSRYGSHACTAGFRRSPYQHRHSTTHVEVMPQCHSYPQEHIHHADPPQHHRASRHASNTSHISVSSVDAIHTVDAVAPTSGSHAVPMADENLNRVIRRTSGNDRFNPLCDVKFKFGFWFSVAIFMFFFTVLKNYTGMHIMSFGMTALVIFIPLLIITGVISIYKGISRLMATEPPHSFIGYDSEDVVGVPVIRVTYVTDPVSTSSPTNPASTPSIDEQPPPPYDEAIKYPTTGRQTQAASSQKRDSSPPPYDKAVT